MIRILIKIIVQYFFNPSFRRFWTKLAINIFCLTCRNITYSLRGNLDFRLPQMPFSQSFWTGIMTSKLVEMWWLPCLILPKLLIKFPTDSFPKNLVIWTFVVNFCLGFVPTLQIGTNVLWSMVLPLNLFLFFLGFPRVLSWVHFFS